MSGIKILCLKIKSNFLEVLEDDPLAAVIMLANLYRSKEEAKGDDLTLLHKTLSGLKEKLEAKNIELLWQTLTTIPPERLLVMDIIHRIVLCRLKHEMICDIDFFKHLPVDSLIELGQDIEFHREVLVALIRRHLVENKQEDPFAKSTFSYKTLKQGNAEQNSQYLAVYVKDCKTLPVDSLVKLGIKDSEIASLILTDLKGSPEHITISSSFAHEHAEIREEIAVELKSYLETLPIKTEERKVIEVELPKLQQKFPEFETVKVDNRVSRNIHIMPVQQEPSFLDHLSLHSAGIFAFTWAAALVFPPTAPFALGCGFVGGLGCASGISIAAGVDHLFFKKNAPASAPAAAQAAVPIANPPVPSPATALLRL